MSWRTDYEKKKCTIPEALSLIRSGDKVITQFGVAVPCALIEGLYDIRDRVTDVEVNFGITKRVFKVFGKDCNGKINVRSSFLYPGERAAIASGSHMGILPIDLSDTYRERYRYTKPDAALVSVAPPDENGYFSLGLHDVDIHQMKDKVRTIIVQVNENIPYIYGENRYLHVSDVDAIVECTEPLQEIPVPEEKPLDKVIASHIIPLIHDGATLQFGVGGPGMVVGKNLKHLKDLGIHTEMFCDTMVELIKCGAVNNSKKKLLPGKTVFGLCQGKTETYDFLDHNRDVEMRSTSWVNDPVNIAVNDNVVSINSAIAVDLTGQVCAESIGTRQYSGTGGHCDFVRGAHLSEGGQSFIAFYSTYNKKDGTVGSKIDLTLPLGSVVTTRRNEVHYIVTEYGVADLQYKTLEERARALIEIAHPDFRDKLRYDAKQAGLIV